MIRYGVFRWEVRSLRLQVVLLLRGAALVERRVSAEPQVGIRSTKDLLFPGLSFRKSYIVEKVARGNP
jgi:hypothetical protein